MAFQYGLYANPQPQGDALSAFLPAFLDSRQAAKDEQAAQAFASLYRQPQTASQPQDNLTALTTPQPATIDASGHPTTVGDRAAELQSFENNVVQAESGGNPNARNPNSSATGPGQFLDGTWADLMQRHPELGLTADGRTDPAQVAKALPVFTRDNAATLQSEGVPVTPTFSLPDRATMLALFRSPEARPLAIQMLQTYQQGQNPANLLDMALKKAEIANYGASPGYRWNADHTAEVAIPGGPGDYNRFLGPAGANGGNTVGTTGSSAIDPTIPGYSTDPKVAGMTQAAIDQKALDNLINDRQPPIGRTGPAGAANVAISNRMAEMGSSANLATNKAQLKSLSGSLVGQQKYLDNTERAFNTANDTLANLQDYMQKNGINPSQFPDANSFLNWMKARGLDPGAAGGYNAQLATLRQEYSQVLAKGGVRSVETDREASQLIPDGLNPAQLAQVAAQIKIDSDNAINEAQSQVSKITAQINGIVSPSSAAQQPAPSAAPAQSAAPAAAVGTTKSIGGKTYVLKADGWYEQ